MSDPSFDLDAAHRWFAVECNNRTWDLVEAPRRTDLEAAEMLQVAHAARFHWQHAGNATNAIRAEYLLAIVYVELQRGEPAQHHAREALKLLTTLSDISLFDRVCVEAAAARAYELNGDSAQAAAHQSRACAAVTQCADESDREVLLKLFPVLR